MGTTPGSGLPYPEGTDLVIGGDDAIQALAERLDALLTPAWVAMVGGTSLANNVWTDVPLTWIAGNDTLPHGAASVSYYGPRRWFMVSFGGNIGANGTTPTSWMRATFDGSPASEMYHTNNMSNMSAAIPMELGAGAYSTVILQAKAADGSGSLGGAITDAYLRITSL